MKRLERFLHPGSQLGYPEPASIGSGFLHVLGYGHNAVIGAERNDIVAASDFLIQTRKEFPEVPVEPHENILNLMAARAEGVAHKVGRRIADAQKIRTAALTEMQRVHGLLSKPSQGSIRKGTRRPFVVVRAVRLGPFRLPTQCVRKSKPPARGRDSACSRRLVKIRGRGKRERPCFAVVLSRGMRFGVFLHKRAPPIDTGSDPRSAAAVEPRDHVRAMPSQHNGCPRLQRNAHHSCHSAVLKTQLIREGRQSEPSRTVASLHRQPGVPDILGIRVRRASNHRLLFTIPPGIADDAVYRRQRTGGDRRVAHAGLRGCVGVRGIAEPCALLHQTF